MKNSMKGGDTYDKKIVFIMSKSLITSKMKGNNKMSQNQKDMIIQLRKDFDELQQLYEDKCQVVLDLQVKLEKSQNGSGRKQQVLDLLRSHKTISILDIAESLNISTKNVSSQLTYLRSDGHMIFTDPNGRKMLVEDTKE